MITLIPATILISNDSPLQRCCRDIRYVIQFAFLMKNYNLKGCMKFLNFLHISPKITRLLVWEKLLIQFNLILIYLVWMFSSLKSMACDMRWVIWFSILFAYALLQKIRNWSENLLVLRNFHLSPFFFNLHQFSPTINNTYIECVLLTTVLVRYPICEWIHLYHDIILYWRLHEIRPLTCKYFVILWRSDNVFFYIKRQSNTDVTGMHLLLATWLWFRYAV